MRLQMRFFIIKSLKREIYFCFGTDMRGVCNVKRESQHKTVRFTLLLKKADALQQQIKKKIEFVALYFYQWGLLDLFLVCPLSRCQCSLLLFLTFVAVDGLCKLGEKEEFIKILRTVGN